MANDSCDGARRPQEPSQTRKLPAIPPGARLFLATGFMGGFTTYSSFNHETLRLLEEGATAYALAYLATTVAGCLVAGALGLASAGFLARLGSRPAL